MIQSKHNNISLYPWLSIIYNQILNSYLINKGHHALLFHSSQNQGEDVLINCIARWLICSKPNTIKHCNICKNCHLMNIKQHPDYYQIDLENNIKSIGIDKIRICIDAIHYSARYSKSKVIFIKCIEHLTNQAMNVLLKILEEPPANTYFFLKTRRFMKIPVTLLSRCLHWSVIPPEESLGLKWLMQKINVIDELSARTALRLCEYAPIEASIILQSEIWKKRLALYKIVDRVIISNGNFLEFLPYFNIYQNNIFLYWFITLLIDILKKQQKVKEQFLINLDQLKLIDTMAKYWNIFSFNNQVKQWLLLFHYFQKFDSINRELLLIHRLLNWKQGVIESYF